MFLPTPSKNWEHATELVPFEASSPSFHWRAPGTCGEFVQGRLDGADYLINSPIDRFSTARLVPTSKPGLSAATPGRHRKVASLLEALRATHAVDRGMEIAVVSDLPQGKGMASSTADLVAAAGAAFHHLGVTPTVDEIARALVAIEPSDCTHIPGVGHVGHLCGRVFGSFRSPLDLRVLVIDCGGVVDTVGFDRARAHQVYKNNEMLVRRALSLALQGLATGNVALLAQGATLSARLNQQVLFKEQFPYLVRVAKNYGGLGVNCAHSGSVLGILYRPAANRGAMLRAAIEREFASAVTIIGDHQFISGGIYVDRN